MKGNHGGTDEGRKEVGGNTGLRLVSSGTITQRNERPKVDLNCLPSFQGSSLT